MKTTVDQAPCPACGGASRPYTTKSAHGDVWRIRACNACGMGFVANRPSLETLGKIYGSFEHLPATATGPDPEQHPDAPALARQVGQLTPSRGKVLDVGCGYGEFSYHLAREGFGPILLIDFDERMRAAERVVSRGEFRRCAFEEVPPEDGPFSVILMSQVLEHALDPLDWLRRARELLTPDGVLAVALPNFNGVYRLLGARDPFLIPPIHLNFFTARSLGLAMERSGLRPVKMSSRSNVTGSRLPHRAWNSVSHVLNPTTRGIVLWAFGKRA